MNLSEIMTVDSAVCFDYPSIEESSETRTNQILASGAGEQMKASEGVHYVLAKKVR